MHRPTPTLRLAFRTFVASVALLGMGSAAHAYSLPVISQTTYNVAYVIPIGSAVGQTFTATGDGSIRQIGVSQNGGDYELYIYEGAGDTGKLLYSESSFLLTNSGFGLGMHTLTRPVPVVGGQVYTFKFVNVSPSMYGARGFNSWVDDKTDQYPSGELLTFGGPNFDPMQDMMFKVVTATDIDVAGDVYLIQSGDTTPQSADGTDFGQVQAVGSFSVVHAFTIKGTSVGPVSITGVTTDNPDFKVTTAPAGTLTPGQRTTFAITFDPAAVTASDNATVQIGTSGAPNPYTFAVHGVGAPDTTPPSITISGPTTHNGSPFDVTITASEPCTGLAASGVAVANGSFAGLQASGGGMGWTGQVTPTSAANPVAVRVSAGACQDLSGNPSLASNTITVASDLIPPAPVITGPTAIQGGPFAIHIDFGELVTGFTLSGLSVQNGAASGFTDNQDGTFDATVTPAANGDVTVSLAAAAASDLAGNPSTAATFTVAADVSVPVPQITAPTAVQNGPFQVTIDFGEPVVGFDLNNVSTGGALSNLTDNGSGSFTFTATPPTGGQQAASGNFVSFELPAGFVTDQGGHPSPDTTFKVPFDVWPPQPSITGPTAANGQFQATIDFGELVTGFDLGGIVVGNGTASNLVDHQDGTFDVTIAPASDGTVTVDVPADACTDLAGNESLAATTLSVVADPNAPAPVISGPTKPQKGVFQVTIDFGEVVTGFALGDVTVGNGVGSGLTDEGGGAYALSITPLKDGEVTVALAAGAAVDEGGHDSLAATTYSVTADLTAPTVSITGPTTSETGPFSVTVAFSEPVVGFTLGGLTVKNGTASSLVDNKDGTYRATLTAAAPGTVTVSVAAGVVTDLAGNPNTASAPASFTVAAAKKKAAATGCSVAAGPGSGGPVALWALFGFLGLATLRRRRRRA